MSQTRRQYPFHLIEPKWQKAWDQQETFRAWNPGEVLPDGHPFAARHGLGGKAAGADELPPKFYILDMFPYPSGAGLHVGHPEGYTATDILARYRRALGFNVLHPMGWDAFGLPAEQYAVKTGKHPRQATGENIATFKRQIRSLGFSYDWTREVDTTDPNYFRWTQWIFLQIYNSWFNPESNRAEPIGMLKYPEEIQLPEEKAGCTVPSAPLRRAEDSPPYLVAADPDLEAKRRAFRDSKRLAYVSEQPVWWCEALGTVLANEEVIDGQSEVGGHPVVRKPMRQWMLRITAYAEKLLQDLETIDWSDSLKEMQRNWIGRSEGAEVDFQIEGSNERIRVFTTRPDTLFGATYLVLAPEHKLLDQIVPEQWPSATPFYFKGPANDRLGPIIWNPSEAQPPDWQQVAAPKDPESIVDFEARANAAGLDVIRLSRDVIQEEALALFPHPLAGRYQVLPVRLEGDCLVVAICDLANLQAIDAVALRIQRRVEARLVLPSEFETVYQDLFGQHRFNSPKEVVRAYRTFASSKSDLERTELAKEKTGVFTGAYAVNPVNGEKIPIWIADYVLISYGTGAIMAVPAHDTRDFEFATKFNLPIVQVVQPPDPKTDWHGFVEDGTSVNSTGPEVSITGLPTPEAKRKITAWLESKGLGKKTINYKLRDWLFSRQRYWGEPFPIVWKRDANGNLHHEALPESALPLLPPPLDDYKPTPDGQPPLARATDWVHLPDGATRELNTMPQWAGSCWYYLRYLDAQNPAAFCGKEAERYWMGVGNPKSEIRNPKSTTPGIDLYVGGTEHAVLHLLYARFWHKVLYDLGHVSTPEPFFKLVNQGLILGEDGQKMSKSRGNVINPDDILKEYGADAFRLYEMFMGPLEMVKPWNTRGVEGVYRFLGRVWRLFVDEKSETEFEQASTMAPQSGPELLERIQLASTIREASPTAGQLKTFHACIKKVTEDLDGLRFNTAISALMVFVNEAMTWETKPVAVLREYLILLQPFAPHLAEELWTKLHSAFRMPPAALAYAPWPTHDPALLVESMIEIPVQVNGKLRDRVVVPADIAQADLEKAALACEKAQQFLAGKTVRKIIVVPGRLVNIVAS